MEGSGVGAVANRRNNGVGVKSGKACTDAGRLGGAGDAISKGGSGINPAVCNLGAGGGVDAEGGAGGGHCRFAGCGVSPCEPIVAHW